MKTLLALVAVTVVSDIFFIVKLHNKLKLIKGLKEIIAELMGRVVALELRDLMAKRYIKNLESRLAEYEPDAYDKDSEIKLPPCMKDLASKTCNCSK